MIAQVVVISVALIVVAAIAIFGDGDVGCGPDCQWCRRD